MWSGRAKALPDHVFEKDTVNQALRYNLIHQNKSIHAAFLTCTLAILVYANSLLNGFVWDDRALILNNKFITSVKNLELLLHRDYYLSPQTTDPQRPIMTISLILDYAVWKLNPLGYHLTNIFLHILNTLLLFIFVRFLARRETAFLSALIFGVHPILTEAVNGINFREDALATFFYLLAFIAFLRGRALSGLFSLTFYSLALMSKEMSITLPVMLVIYLLCFKRDNLKTINVRWLLTCYFLLSAFYVWLLSMLIPHLGTSRGGVPLASIPSIIMYYVKLILFPINLNAIHAVGFINIPGVELLSFASLIAILAAAAYMLKRSPEMFFGVIWFFVTILPMSGLVRVSDTVIAERYLYLPAIGILLTMGAFVLKIIQLMEGRKSLIFYLTALCLLFYSGLTYKRNKVWHNEYTLWADSVKKSPRNPMVRYNLGVATAEQGRFEEAISEFNEVLKNNPDNSRAKESIEWVNGLIKKKDVNRALKKGIASAEKGDFEEAKKEFKSVIAIEPGLVEPHFDLGMVCYDSGDCKCAIAEFNTVLAIDPKHEKAKEYLDSYLEKTRSN